MFQQPVIQTNILLPGMPSRTQVDVLRLDKVHPVISGNKWFKLQGYVSEALAHQHHTLLTFGGAYSNHIVATAAACQLKGLQSIGIIRGERPSKLSHTLQQAMEYGMQLEFISREQYRLKIIPAHLQQQDIYVVNEGGYGLQGAEGIARMLQQIELSPYHYMACAVGTGTTLAGLVKASLPHQVMIGVPLLKNFPGIREELTALLSDDEQRRPVDWENDFHFNGYAKYTGELIHFMNHFYQTNNIPTDFVYTGKLFFALSKKVQEEKYNGKKLLVLHSGGLQGNQSLPEGTLIF